MISRRVEIGGLTVELRSHGAAARSAMTELGRLLPDGRGEPSLTISCEGRGPIVPSRPPDRADGPVKVWRDRDALYLLHGETVSGRVSEARAEWGGNEAALPVACHQLFPFAIAHLLAAHDRFVLHGAAVHRHGATMLVLGGSGSGKSTVAVAALRRSWTVMSDDLVVVRAGPDGPEVSGIARPMYAPGDVVASPAVRSLTGSDHRDRQEVEVPAWDREWRPVTAIVVTDHGGAGLGTLAPLDGPELLRWLLFSHLSRGERLRLRRYLPLAAALSRRPAHRLHHGTDVTRRLDRAAALLEMAATRG